MNAQHSVIPHEPESGNKKSALLPPDLEPRLDREQPSKFFLDEKELLTRIPISRRTLWTWRKSGKIPYINLGRRVLFDWESVRLALLRAQRNG